MDASGAPILSWSDRIQRVHNLSGTAIDSGGSPIELPSIISAWGTDVSNDCLTWSNNVFNSIKSPPPKNFFPVSWSERAKTPSAKGALRFLQPPKEDDNSQWWMIDRSITDWLTLIGTARADRSNTINMPDAVSTDASGCAVPTTQGLIDSHYNSLRRAFGRLQRPRYLARKMLNRWIQKLWAKRPQCNTDLIDNVEVKDADAITLTDTTNRTVFRFHRRDIFNNLLSKITLSDEMLPSPRPPTNPWTNQELTLAQTIAICQKLVADFGRRGRCPPVLFAAFCAAGYNVKRFEADNSGLLASHAIHSFFKDIHEHNRDTVCDTILQLLEDSGVAYSPVAVRRWIRTTGPQHREWLNMVRDYTLYINLHIQVRRHWHDYAAIRADVRELYRRTPMTNADVAGPRMRLLRNRLSDTAALLPSDMGYGFGGVAAGASAPIFSSLFGSLLGSPFENISVLIPLHSAGAAPQLQAGTGEAAGAAPAAAAAPATPAAPAAAAAAAAPAQAAVVQPMTTEEAIAIIQNALFRM